MVASCTIQKRGKSRRPVQQGKRTPLQKWRHSQKVQRHQEAPHPKRRYSPLSHAGRCSHTTRCTPWRSALRTAFPLAVSVTARSASPSPNTLRCKSVACCSAATRAVIVSVPPIRSPPCRSSHHCWCCCCCGAGANPASGTTSMRARSCRQRSRSLSPAKPSTRVWNCTTAAALATSLRPSATRDAMLCSVRSPECSARQHSAQCVFLAAHA
mmetsp:Transcript_1641/g.4424  ORF Transcript_1641/g.4424 Transcript_1641/m.4424 type:complete len:212 (+) Transcript_1641:229-864(+)